MQGISGFLWHGTSLNTLTPGARTPTWGLTMGFMVPYDGSDLADAALDRATTHGEALDRRVVAVTVVPEGHDYAVEHGWLEPDETFDAERVRRRLREQIDAVAPGTELHVKRVPRYLSHGGIAKRLRDAAREMDATVLFVGSESAGRVVQPITSIGGAVTADEEFDVFLVRERR
jgi:nucleotide-binding universal stress UspA family protein